MGSEATLGQFEYDVAFSFLARDEAIAVELNDLLADRLRTFIYSERQLELAGTDGEEAFAKVFGEQSRSVVVLYRDGWGKSPWTRVEETAIRNRGHHEGFDFALFVSLDGTKPRWLPESRIWIGYGRWGAKPAAAVIERRASELGSDASTETLVDREKRLQRSLAAKNLRDTFNRDGNAGFVFQAQVTELQSQIETHISDLVKAGSNISFIAKRDHSALVIAGALAGLRIDFDVGIANVLDTWTLTIHVTRGHPRMTGAWYMQDPPRPLVVIQFTAVGGDDLGFRWIEKGKGDQAPQSNEQIAERSVRLLLDNIEKIAHEKHH